MPRETPAHDQHRGQTPASSGALGGSTGWRGHGRRAPTSSLARGSADFRRDQRHSVDSAPQLANLTECFIIFCFVSSDSTPDFPPGTGAPAIRAFNAAGYQSYRDLAGIPREDLASLHGVGPKSLRIIQAALESEGKSLG